MARTRRFIQSGGCYDISFRARSTLPFVAYDVIREIIASSLARAQRDDKVVLCHDIWEGSHPHLIIVAKDKAQCVNFYSEIQKKITDSLKRLLGLNYLNIWEGRPHVALIADLDKAIEQIAYLYSNPAQDNLVESIDSFPGYSSWRGFKNSINNLEAETKETVPWIRLPTIPKAPSNVLTFDQDRALVRLIRKANKKTHTLRRNPNLWMKCFGVEDSNDVEEINQRILEQIQLNEEDARQKRTTPVMGSSKLRSQPILKPHKPKKHSRKVFVLSSVAELRIAIMAKFYEICKECRRCYERWLQGDFKVEWPSGVFKPSVPSNSNYLFAPSQ